LPLLDSGRLSLQSFLSGRKAAVVVFWSGICSHCRRYDDYCNRLSERYPDVGLLAVASRQNESAQMLRATVAERGLWFSMVHDADRTVAHAWLVAQTPRVFLLDLQRRLLYRGAIDNFKYPQDPEFVPYLDTAIEAFLAGKSLPRAETPSFGCPIESVYYTLPKP
jgi:thiol-disulfide isomerase/thioredoxin